MRSVWCIAILELQNELTSVRHRIHVNERSDTAWLSQVLPLGDDA